MTEAEEVRQEHSAWRVLVVDDHPIVRQGLRTILEAAGDIVVAAEAGRAYEALDVLAALTVDAVLLDVGLPDLNGIEVVRMIHRIKPRLPVLVLSVHEEELYAVRAIQAGAAGYLTKSSATQQLVAATRQIVQGGRYITASVADKLAAAIDVKVSSDRPPHERLSLREMDVLRMIAQGKPLKSISELMHLSPKTVSTYRARVLDKLRMRTNEELIQYALANGLLR